jgi:hypothetical protein
MYHLTDSLTPETCQQECQKAVANKKCHDRIATAALYVVSDVGIRFPS